MINLKNIKAIFFDLDGVLVNSYFAWYRLFNDTLKHFGYKPISEKVFNKHWGQSTQEDVRIFMPGRNVNEIIRYFSNHYTKYISYLKINPRVYAILKKLRTLEFKLGCITNSHRDITREILKIYELAEFFNVIITADDVKRPKPAPDIILKACKILGITVKQIIFLGDTAVDIEAGKNAGCVVIGYRIESELTVKNLDEFFKLLTRQ